MTLQDFLHDFVDVFHQNFLPKRCFHGWTRSFDWGISSLLNILGKSAWKIPRKSRLTLSSLTTVTIGFLAAAYYQVGGGNAIKSGENSLVKKNFAGGNENSIPFPGTRGSTSTAFSRSSSRQRLLNSQHSVPTAIHLEFLVISNGNKSEWSPVRSVIVRVITKSDDHAAGVRFFLTRAWLQTELDYTKSYYQFIIKITISLKRKIAKVWKKGKSCKKDWLVDLNYNY